MELEKSGRKTTLYAVTESNARFNEDIKITLTKDTANFIIATLNIRILNDDKLDAIVLFIIQHKVDILFLQDTRASEGRSVHFAEQLQANCTSNSTKCGPCAGTLQHPCRRKANNS